MEGALTSVLAGLVRAPVVAVPTTYAGSEVTPVWGLTENGRKTTGTDTAVLTIPGCCDFVELDVSFLGDTVLLDGEGFDPPSVAPEWGVLER